MKAEFTDIPDEVWERLKVWLPARPIHRKGGRPRNDDRRVMSGIVYRLKTGCQWDAIPREFGSGNTCYDRFREWQAAGVFHMLHVEMVLFYDQQVGVDLTWCSMDSATVKAPKGGTSPAPVPPIARNPARNGTS
jgi:putative transposase